MDEKFAKSFQLNILPYNGIISMADSAHTTSVKGRSIIDIKLSISPTLYEKVPVLIMRHCVSDVLLGDPFYRKHPQVSFHYGGELPPLNVCAFGTPSIAPPRIFTHLSSDCHLVATKSRSYSDEHRTFIKSENKRFLEDKIRNKEINKTPTSFLPNLMFTFS